MTRFSAGSCLRLSSGALQGASSLASATLGYTIASACVALLVGCLSISPVLNLFSGSQVMNRSFDPLNLVNTYGAFGSVGRERSEIVFEGTQDDLITSRTQWKEYEFPYKPGDPTSLPACYHALLWPARLADLVRGDGKPSGISVDVQFHLETSPQRSRNSFPAR